MALFKPAANKLRSWRKLCLHRPRTDPSASPVPRPAPAGPPQDPPHHETPALPDALRAQATPIHQRVCQPNSSRLFSVLHRGPRTPSLDPHGLQWYLAGPHRTRILRYLIIHWKSETELSEGALLEGQLTISIEALSSKHLPNSLHCAITIASTGSVHGGLVFKKFLQEIQPVLPQFSAQLTWASEEGDHSQETSGRTPFQMIFKVDESPRSLMTDCLVIKHFLRKIIIVHHKLKFNFSLTVNGIHSAEIFGAENEPTLRLSNGITLAVGFQHYVSKPKLSSSGSHCSRIHPVLGHPAVLSVPDSMADMGSVGRLTLTPVAALCPSPKGFSSQLNRISSVSIFLYGPLGLPLISDQEQPSTTVFRDTSYFIDWKKHNLFMVPTLDLNLDTDLVLPDVCYQVESSEGNQSQVMDSQGPVLLLFLFVDFHSGFPVQQVEIWGLHTLLTAHLSAILSESRSTVQDSIHSAVDQVLERHHQAAQAHQRLQGSLSVAVNSIMSVLTGSTCSSFRKTCLQALEAADTQEFGNKLHRIFYDTTQHRLRHHCSCDTEQHPTAEKRHPAQSTEGWHENIGSESLVETSGQAENKKLKRSPNQGKEESQALCPARDLSPPESATGHHEPTVASPNARGSQAQAAHGRVPAADAASPAGGLEVLWRARGGCGPGLLPLGPHHCLLCSRRTCGCRRSPICPSG
ncbi:type 2 DNA topoisomerase 6 subunit B-like [Peromyscus californicus insignis]|uniref:type 2 DNA topoisomerase 6 subunit B-like n=1 Tax=Peromyscus californicus insignis TaxID=564181 RepID=UPI0022A6C518|nr:type 2 DNA topoisomerase 6 subunit B-like [Peromyscus californicus insignis]